MKVLTHIIGSFSVCGKTGLFHRLLGRWRFDRGASMVLVFALMNVPAFGQYTRELPTDSPENRARIQAENEDRFRQRIGETWSKGRDDFRKEREEEFMRQNSGQAHRRAEQEGDSDRDENSTSASEDRHDALGDNSLVRRIATMIGLIAGALLIGALCGLVPLLVGKARKQTILGIVGFCVCIVAGALSGVVLALPLALGFTVWILMKSRTRGASSPTPTAPAPTQSSSTAPVDERWIHVLREQTESGPYREQDVREAIVNGSLSSTDLGWCEGYSEWLPLATLLHGASPASSESVATSDATSTNSQSAGSSASKKIALRSSIAAGAIGLVVVAIVAHFRPGGGLEGDTVLKRMKAGLKSTGFAVLPPITGSPTIHQSSKGRSLLVTINTIKPNSDISSIEIKREFSINSYHSQTDETFSNAVAATLGLLLPQDKFLALSQWHMEPVARNQFPSEQNSIFASRRVGNDAVIDSQWELKGDTVTERLYWWQPDMKEWMTTPELEEAPDGQKQPHAVSGGPRYSDPTVLKEQ